MTIFNPYKDAAGDVALVRYANRSNWRTMCFGCGTDKPIAGGTFPQKKGVKAVMQKNGLLRRFVCAECLAKRETPNVGVEPPQVGSNDGLGRIG